MAEYEHQFKVIDEAQKIFVEREMMPKDIEREFLTGPRMFDEIMEKLEIIINEMIADDGPVPMNLGNVSVHDTKSTQGDSDTSNDKSYEDVCAIGWKGYKAAKGAGKKGSKGSKPDWHSDKDKGSKGTGKGKSKGKNETRCCYDCGGQGPIGVNCPYKRTNNIGEEDDQTSSWESEPEGENAEELASLERNAGGAQWVWKKVTVVVDSGAAENVMPRSMFSWKGIRQTERSKHGKGFKGPGGENIKNYGQQVMSVKTPEGFVQKSTRQVADVRKPLVSASHTIQAGNDLFIGKDEAYIMNRKKEKSLLRKEGNLYVLDLFVKVPPSATMPIRCPWRLIQSTRC